MKVEEREAADLLTPVAAEEFDQPMRGGDISSDRMRTAAAVMGEVASPARG